MGHGRFQGVEGERRQRNEWQGRRDSSSRSEFAIRALIFVALLCAGIVTLWFGYKAINVWLAIFAGILIAVLFRTMADPLVKYARLPLWVAILIVCVLTLGLLALAGWWMAPSISQQFAEMTVRLPEAIDRLRAQFLSYNWAEWLVQKGESATDGRKVLQQITHAFQIT